MCLICFQIVVMTDSMQITIYAAVLLVVLSEVFLLCHHGQKLIDSSLKISYCIYDSKWYAVKDINVRKMLPMMLKITQRAKCVSGFGFVDMCNETFSTVRKIITDLFSFC